MGSIYRNSIRKYLSWGVVGVRGMVGDDVNYDVSLGTPIKKPEGFDTDTRVWAFRGSYQF